MRLGWRTKAILETLLLSGAESLNLLTHLRSSKPYYASYAHDSEASRQLLRMERAGLIAIERGQEQSQWIVRLTSAGKESVCDNIDPDDAWTESWDGQWTTIAFDIPATERDRRRALDVWLKKRRFGRMQGSVWVSHRPHPQITEELQKQEIPLTWLAIIQGKVVSQKSDRELAREFWDFQKINEAYESYQNHLATTFEEDSQNAKKQWFTTESQLWKNAFESDPFLPGTLLPTNYLGKAAWEKRKALHAVSSES